jgi:phospholipid transport system substrate-binding protein
VTARSITRAALLAGMLGVGLIAAAPAAYAARNTEAEQYVQENAAEALRTLGSRTTSVSQRRATFDTLMQRFSDMPRISNFVLGRYGAQLRSDASLRAEWTRTFQDYAIAVYEDRLGRLSGSTVRVTGSTERVARRDVIVTSELQPQGGGRATTVQWRILRSSDSAAWKVVDVSLLIDGNQIWLAQQQQRDFLAQLDRSNGDIRGLMANLRTSTAAMRQRVMARS